MLFINYIEIILKLFYIVFLTAIQVTRETLSAARLVGDGWSALDAMELTFLPLFEVTKLDGERSVVSKIFMTR